MWEGRCNLKMKNKNILNKRLRRNINKHIAFFIGSIFLTVLTIGFIIAAVSAGESIQGTIEDFTDKAQVEDANFTTAIYMNDQQLTDIEDKFDVVIEEMKYIDFVEAGRTLRIFRETFKINIPEFKPSNLLEGGISLSEGYMKNANISIDDKISIGDIELSVNANVARPDYLYMLKDFADSYIDEVNFGIAVVNDATYDMILDQLDEADEITYYSIVFQGSDVDTVAFRKEISENYGLYSYQSSDDNRRITIALDQGNGIKGMATTFSPILFILIIGFVCIVLSRMLKQDARQIGILSAIGYRKQEIKGYYVKYGLLIAVAGDVGGVIFGLLITNPLANYYYSFYDLANTYVGYSFSAIFVAIILPPIMLVSASLIVIHGTLKIRTIDLLSGKKIKQKSKQILVKSKISFMAKYKIRYLFRNKISTILVMFGVTVASCIILVGFFMYSSFDRFIEKDMKDSINYEYVYVFNQIKNGSEGFEGEQFLISSFELESGISFSIQSFAEKSDYLSLTDTRNQKIESGEGVYITTAMAKQTGIQEGDNMDFLNPITLEKYSLDVSGIVDDNQDVAAYLSYEIFIELFKLEDGDYNAIYSDKELSIKNDELSLMQNKDELIKNLINLFQPFITIIYMIIVIGIFLCILIIYLTTDIIIGESKNNVSMLKVLGYYKGEINRMVLNINSYLVLIGFVISIPLSILMSEFIFTSNIEDFNGYIEPAIDIELLVLGFVIVYVSYWLSLQLLKRKIRAISMVDSLKDCRE